MPSLTKEELKLMDEYFRVLNYLSVAQLYLLNNPLLRTPLRMEDVKPNVVGHFGTAPGQNFIYMHLNRVIKKYNLKMIVGLITGFMSGRTFIPSALNNTNLFVLGLPRSNEGNETNAWDIK